MKNENYIIQLHRNLLDFFTNFYGFFIFIFYFLLSTK